MYDVFQTEKLIDLWLTEDIGYCDLTAQLMIDEDTVGTFHMNAREPMHVAGIDVAARVFANTTRNSRSRVLSKTVTKLKKARDC